MEEREYFVSFEELVTRRYRVTARTLDEALSIGEQYHQDGEEGEIQSREVIESDAFEAGDED